MGARMAYTLDEVAAMMSMRPHTITDWHEVVDGLLVVTSEGAQTLIRPDGRVEAVLPRRELLNAGGRGSAKRWAETQPPGPDLTEVHVTEVAGADCPTCGGVGAVEPDFDTCPDCGGSGEPEEEVEAVPDGSAAEVLAWAGDDRDRLERALDVEVKRETPRSTLVTKLSNALAKIGFVS